MSTLEMTQRDAEKIAAQAESQVQEQATLTEEIADLRRRETVAVEQALRDGKPARGPGRQAESLRRKREAAERRLVELTEFEIPAAHRLAAEAQTAIVAAKIEHAKSASRELDPIDAENIERLARAFEESCRAYAALGETAQAREAIYERLEAAGIVAALPEADRYPLQLHFQSALNPWPVDLTAAFEAIGEAVFDDHAGNPDYADYLKQRYSTAWRFVPLLEEARADRLWRRVWLRLSDNRTPRNG